MGEGDLADEENAASTSGASPPLSSSSSAAPAVAVVDSQKASPSSNQATSLLSQAINAHSAKHGAMAPSPSSPSHLGFLMGTPSSGGGSRISTALSESLPPPSIEEAERSVKLLSRMRRSILLNDGGNMMERRKSSFAGSPDSGATGGVRIPIIVTPSRSDEAHEDEENGDLTPETFTTLVRKATLIPSQIPENMALDVGTSRRWTLPKLAHDTKFAILVSLVTFFIMGIPFVTLELLGELHGRDWILLVYSSFHGALGFGTLSLLIQRRHWKAIKPRSWKLLVIEVLGNVAMFWFFVLNIIVKHRNCVLRAFIEIFFGAFYTLPLGIRTWRLMCLMQVEHHLQRWWRVGNDSLLTEEQKALVAQIKVLKSRISEASSLRRFGLCQIPNATAIIVIIIAASLDPLDCPKLGRRFDYATWPTWIDIYFILSQFGVLFFLLYVWRRRRKYQVVEGFSLAREILALVALWIALGLAFIIVNYAARKEKSYPIHITIIPLLSLTLSLCISNVFPIWLAWKRQQELKRFRAWEVDHFEETNHRGTVLSSPRAGGGGQTPRNASGGGGRGSCSSNASAFDADTGLLKLELSEVLGHPVGMELFMLHLQAEFSSEALMFWRDVEKFRTMSSDGYVDNKLKAQLALKIYNNYIPPDSNFAVNITSIAIAGVEKQLRECGLLTVAEVRRPTSTLPVYGDGVEYPLPPHVEEIDVPANVFDKSQFEVYRTMVQDSYSRFIKSELFERFVRELEARAQLLELKVDMKDIISA